MQDPAPSRRSIIFGSIVVAWIAIALRVPSCYESLWLDELHSGWCVWGSLGEVLPRATMGHQSPFYFSGLWFWRQLVGDSEIALRLSSLLAVAASSVILTIGVAGWTGSMAAGLAAGLVIALDSNAIFFGTELRPYAFVILFASIAVNCFLRLAATDSRHEHRRYWSTMIIAILLSALCQPTSIGVLVGLPLVLCCVWLARDSRRLFKITPLDISLCLMVAAVGLLLWRMTLGETWQQRSNWASFAHVTQVREICKAWEWTWLLLIPIGFALISVVVAKLRTKISSDRDMLITTLLLALLASLATSLYWVVSRADWVPIWHRRYFIAVLPILACVVGGSIGVVQSVIRPHRAATVIGFVTAAVLVIGLTHSQGTLQRLPDYPVALAVRGEDWRAANAWVRSNAKPADLIYLDAGLVEAKDWLIAASPSGGQPTAEQLDYLAFAANGPYGIGRKVSPTTLNFPLPIDQLPSEWIDMAGNRSAASRVIVITRRPATGVNQFGQFDRSKILGFGNVSVVVQPRLPDRGF